MTADGDIDKDLVARNIQAFRDAMPELAALLEAHRPQSRLVRNAAGDWDVEFRGEFLYGPEGRKRVEQQVEAGAIAPEKRIVVSPLSSANVDLVTERFLYQTLKRATDAGISFLRYPETPEAFHLVSFGLGLGYHLPGLMEQVKPASIIIVEPNLDFLHHSLAVMDWRPYMEMRERSPYRCFICFADNPGLIAKQVRSLMRSSCPMTVDWSRVHQAYPSPVLDAALGEFRRDANLIGIGLGFFHDEMEMTRASYMNLKDADYRILKRSSDALRTPVFVVGSGPSLDDDIEVIKANQDRAVIISCGTASRVLLANGIKPDFQMLLENGAAPYRALAAVHEEFGFGDATLIASNTVDPRVKKLFQDTVYYFRTALSSYALFSPGQQFSLEDSGPTVTNTGVAAALAMGFREMYLFGVDLGTRSLKRHHSKHSLYRHDDDAKDGQKGAMDFTTKFDQRDIGNFGGLIHTETIMLWTRDALARAIGQFRPAVEAFNCSDGLLIENTRPMNASSIRLKSTPEGKIKDLAKVRGSFPPGTEAHFKERWERENWPEYVKSLLDKLQGAVEDHAGNINDIIVEFADLMITEFRGPATVAQFFVRGTVMMVAMCLDYYARRVQSADKTAEFWTIAEEEFIDLMRVMTLQVEWFFENIEAFESDEELFKDLTEWRYE